MASRTTPHRLPESWLRHLSEFGEHLRQSGFSELIVTRFRVSARHFLIWLETDGIALEAVDAAVLRRFRDHDCRCVRTKHGHGYKRDAIRSWDFLAGAVRLVWFLERRGCVLHPGELDHGLGLVEDFLDLFRSEDYSARTLRSYKGACRHFVVWLHGSRIPLKEIDARTIERFVEHDCLCMLGFRTLKRRSADTVTVYKAQVRQFVSFLIERGQIPDTASPRANEPYAALEEYRTWLRRHRGLAERTIRQHIEKAAAFVADLGDDPSRYDVNLIRKILLRRFATVSPRHAKGLAASMRMYLRFLVSKGNCSAKLIDAVPTTPCWRLTELPRYLPLDDVERVIDSCDLTTRAGIRDRAILLLLARLALRGDDVVNLRLRDIDWRNAQLQVCGKSKRTVRLPLPQDVGDALLHYIEHARPRVGEDKVFLCVFPPYRPPRKISSVVSLALKRSGVKSPSGRGAHLIRHSVATGLLRSGASLESIGVLLRHRSPDTTAIYAKVDTPMLKEVAQPWIGDLG